MNNQIVQLSKYWRKSIWSLLLLLSSSLSFAQNGMVGDGFGGRLWYNPVSNYSMGSYHAYVICNGTVNTLDRAGYGSASGFATVTNVKYLTSGYCHGFIKTDGTGWTVGGFSHFPIAPTQYMTNVKFVDMGIDHAAFIKNDGTVWSVGMNPYGAFGNGTTGPAASPVLTPAQMTGVTNAVRVAAGVHFTAVLRADGTVVQTGTMANPSLPISVLVPTVVPGLSNIVDIKASNYVIAALDAAGDVYTWGLPYYELGRGFTSTGTASVPYSNVQPVGKLTFPAGAGTIVALAAVSDGNLFYALDDLGKLYSWGTYTGGTSPVAPTGTGVAESTPKFVMSGVKDILAGESNGWVIKNDNSVWGVGRVTGPWLDNSGTTGTASVATFKNMTPIASPYCAPVFIVNCTAGTVAPALNTTTKANVCPATTVDLSSITASNLPVGKTLTWHSGTPATNANKLGSVTALAAGTYYAAFFDALNNCYSGTNGSATTSVTATVTSCITVCNAGYMVPVPR